LIVAYK